VMLITAGDSAVRAVDSAITARSASSCTAAQAHALAHTRRQGEASGVPGDTIVTAGSPADSKCRRSSRRASRSARFTSVGQNETDIFKQIQVQPFADLSSLQSVLVLVPKPKPVQHAKHRGADDAVKAAGLLFVAVLVQCRSSALLARRQPRPAPRRAALGRPPPRLDLRRRRRLRAGLLWTSRTSTRSGSPPSCSTIAGFWIGRYGETTARDRFHAPYLSVWWSRPLRRRRARAPLLPRQLRAGTRRPQRRCRPRCSGTSSSPGRSTASCAGSSRRSSLTDRAYEVRLLG
jgi:hypothetical protein